MDPALKESILGDLRLANALLLNGAKELGGQVLRIALTRMENARRDLSDGVADWLEGGLAKRLESHREVTRE